MVGKNQARQSRALVRPRRAYTADVWRRLHSQNPERSHALDTRKGNAGPTNRWSSGTLRLLSGVFVVSERMFDSLIFSTYNIHYYTNLRLINDRTSCLCLSLLPRISRNLSSHRRKAALPGLEIRRRLHSSCLHGRLEAPSLSKS